jgi:hypothetical protein
MRSAEIGRRFRSTAAVAIVLVACAFADAAAGRDGDGSMAREATG